MLLDLGWGTYSSAGIEGTAASRVGRSIASVPSCMPCMSFLAFEAFFNRKEEQIKKNGDRSIAHVQEFMEKKSIWMYTLSNK